MLHKHFLPTLGNDRLTAITDEDLAEIIDDLLDTPSEANHAFKEARTFFRWAAKPPRRYVLVSPLQGMEMPAKEKRRRRVLTDEELVKVWRAAGEWGYPYGTIVQLLIAMGQRRGETAWLHRSWINERDRLITLPGEYKALSISISGAYLMVALSAGSPCASSRSRLRRQRKRQLYVISLTAL